MVKYIWHIWLAMAPFDCFLPWSLSWFLPTIMCCVVVYEVYPIPIWEKDYTASTRTMCNQPSERKEGNKNEVIQSKGKLPHNICQAM